MVCAQGIAVANTHIKIDMDYGMPNTRYANGVSFRSMGGPVRSWCSVQLRTKMRRSVGDFPFRPTDVATTQRDFFCGLRHFVSVIVVVVVVATVSFTPRSVQLY